MSVTVVSALARRTLNEWLGEHDAETQDFLKTMAKGFGHFESIGYQANDPAQQSDLMDHLRQAREAVQKNALENARACLK